MPDIESLLTRWQSAGVLDAETAARIRAHEAQASPDSPAGLKWQGITALILGAILLACGVILFISAHWDQLGPGARFTLVIAMVAVFHIAGGFARPRFLGLSTALHAVGTVATGAAIALVGQIFNIQEHWPAADSSLGARRSRRLGAPSRSGAANARAPSRPRVDRLRARLPHERPYRRRHLHGPRLFVWAILYITFFIGSRRRAVQGILFAVSIVAAVLAIYGMLSAWESGNSSQTFIPFGTRVWAWIAIAALPLIIAAFHGHKGLAPVAVAIAFCLALPWCYRTWTHSYTTPEGITNTWTGTDPNLLAYALVAAFAVFLCWWGVRLVSRALVNLGIVGFAATVAWFYFSDILNKMNRSLGLIGLGILFLAGGWALEKMRRRILARMVPAKPPDKIAAETNGGAQ